MLSTAPLRGVTVVEIGHSVAAPYAGMILGELGANVVKVENPKSGGDYARGWGPPFQYGVATGFHAFNRAKSSVAIDLAATDDAERLRRFILSDADVVLHNFKFGALDRYGFDAASLCAAKPSLIYCNLGAFGRTGPLRDLPGYDPLMQAFSGLMGLQGNVDGPPVRVGVSIVDMAAGMWSVIGILAALNERGRSGKGGVVDTSLLETALAWMSVPIAGYLGAGDVPAKAGSGMGSIVPYQAFEAADGWIMVAAGNDGLFARLAKAMQLDQLADDARFATNAARVTNRAALIAVLEARFREDTLARWVELLGAVGVPCGPLQTVDEVLQHAQTRALDLVQTSPDGAMSLVGLPISFDGVRAPFDRRPPTLGEHNAMLDRSNG